MISQWFRVGPLLALQSHLRAVGGLQLGSDALLDTLVQEYYAHGGERVPLRWMPTEAVRDANFSAKSDVWSFAVLIWEVALLLSCRLARQGSFGDRMSKPRAGVTLERSLVATGYLLVHSGG